MKNEKEKRLKKRKGRNKGRKLVNEVNESQRELLKVIEMNEATVLQMSVRVE